MACEVCCETYTREVTCPACSFKTCHNCACTFICSSMKEPCCMKCKKVWSREFALEAIDRHSIVQHIANLVFEQEKSLLPTSQVKAVEERRRREYSAQLRKLPTLTKIKKLRDSTQRVAEHTRIKMERHKLRALLSNLHHNERTVSKELPKATVFIMHCPADICRGFINTEYICETCESQVCKTCLTLLCESKQHICNDNDILTAKTIRKDTKPCPKCQTFISKAGGCDQMWCVQCHTTFSWETGNIVTGVVHNPHYYEWLQTQSHSEAGHSRELENAACGEIPTPWEILNILERRGVETWNRRRIIFMHQQLMHLIHQVIPSVPRPDQVKANEDIRIAYLLNDIDDEQMKSRLLHRERRRMKLKAIYNIIDLTVVVVSDFIRRVMFNKNIVYHDLLIEYSNYTLYYKNALQKIIDVHGGAIPLQLNTLFA